MTDKEIVKALKICSKEDASCGKCPLFAKKGIRCICFLQKNALDLINRLEAENDSLNYDMELLKQEKAYVETEAIKEFAERLIAKCDAPHWCVWKSEIEDELKEMEGSE